MTFFEILESIMLPNRDNGKFFTDVRRIEKIEELLRGSRYQRVDADGLFFLYSAVPPETIKDPILISSHIDCEVGITRFFTQEYDDVCIKGTYDNAITNAAILFLMLEGSLPDSVIVAFTGDEEEDSTGALELIRYFSRKRKIPLATIVLDVTNEGWRQKADFTIENNFWEDDIGRRVVEAVDALSAKWNFVPSDPDEIPEYVDDAHLIPYEADADESWDYDEYNWECFSYCLPVRGDMHSNRGVLARKAGCLAYIAGLLAIIEALCRN